jgi:hypothetical protein
MKFSRRDFIHAGCLVAGATLAPSIVDKAEAFWHGIAPATLNNNRVTINVPAGGVGLMNFAKAWSPTSPAPLTPAQIDSNGYPNNITLGSAVSSGINLMPNYYGQYVHSWTGLGAMQYIGRDAIVNDGGAFCGLGANTGVVTGNFTISGINPSVTFKFGTLVTGISGGSGSLVTIITASLNFGSGIGTNNTVRFGVGCSSNLINGPNPDGSWTITNVSGTQFTLNNSTGVISPTVTTTGGVGSQTEAVIANSNPSLQYNATTFTGFTSLVICAAANATAISNGQIWDQAFVNQILTLKGTPGGVGRGGDFWLRFMDTSGVQGSFECDFSQRLTATSQSWTSTANTPIAYYAGAITNGGASGGFTDLFSCASNPSNSPTSGPPIDCEVIQGTPSATNSGGLPGLTVSGRSGFGNWPIIDNVIEPIIFHVSSPPASAGLVLAFTFSASWLNGGTPYTGFSYTTVSGDTASISAFNANLAAALILNTTLKAGKIVFTNSGLVVAIPPTALSGVLTVTYTSGPAILTMCTLVPSTIGTSGTRTFVFNALLGAFIYNGQSFVQSYPAEAIVELCNRASANCWYNWPIYTKGAYITAFTNFMASNTTGLTSGLKFGTEVGNEMWNFGAQLWGKAQTYGIALGCFSYPYGSNEGPYSWSGLRTIQYANLSIAAWGAVRTASQHYILSMTQVDDTTVGGNFDLNWLQGQFLVTSNSNYANYSGLGWVASANSYNVSGNQPVDITTAIGMAPYDGSFWMGGSASGGPDPMNGTVAQNAAMLQASIDYANGLTSTAFGELTNQFNGTTTKSGGSTGAYNLGVSYLARFILQEALAAEYDSRRIAAGKAKLGILHYEGGPQWALGANLNNGVNTPNSTTAAITSNASSDLTALVTAMTNLGWTTTQLIPYTISGTGNLTEVATNLLQMSQGWKYDTDLNGGAANTGSYKSFRKTYYYTAVVSVSGANREVHGCQYGYAGGQWALMWSTYNAVGPTYQNYNAIAEFNT